MKTDDLVNYSKNNIPAGLILFLLLISTGLKTEAQSRFPVVQVYSGNSSYINEPSICINPKNLNQIVAGSVLNDYYYSSNGGVSYVHGTLSCSYGVWGDPAIIVDTSNNFYYLHLSYPSGGGWWIDRIVCQKSTNGGQTWSDGSYMGWNTNPKKQDKAWGAVDRSNNNIYVTWTQFDEYGTSNSADSSVILFAKSTDGGLNWTNPATRISRRAGDCTDDDNTDEGAVPCVGPNGEIYVSWAGPLGLMFNRSLDHGNTWVDSNIFVTTIPYGWNYLIPGIDRSNGMPVTCCDISNGTYHGNIYINWSDQRNGTTDTDIWFVKSTDSGLHWSMPQRVNDDPPGKQQFFTWMSVDQVTGYIYIVFYDRRNYSNTQTDVYMAVSRDGGMTFENMRISQAPFTPNSGCFFGDYTNIIACNNIVRPIWGTLSGSNTKTIYSAIIDSLYAATITWVGGVSNAWNNPWNWSPRAIPSSIQNVVIPEIPLSNSYPEINLNGLSCNNLTICKNASLIVQSGISLTVNGSLFLLNTSASMITGKIKVNGSVETEKP